MYDIISKKRDKGVLNKQEIDFFIDGYVKRKIPDYQMSALLMAIYLNGMNDDEIKDLTMAMVNSGEKLNLSKIKGVKVDKHSTGGIGDKTTLVVAPIVAACGVKVAKMSGRGLGYTGGTIDKLESIPGFKTTISQSEFIKNVNSVNLAIVGQSGLLTPADKKIYELRDVTATVESVPLIAASIMSKKIAAGCDAILLDVKVGKGAFMKTYEDAVTLAKKMVSIGRLTDKKVLALITDMNQPLGRAVGNSLEVIEAVNTLQNRGPKDLTRICENLAANMLFLADEGDITHCESEVREALKSGKAFDKFVEMVKAQGGDETYIKDTSKFERSKFICEVISDQSGYIKSIDAELCGRASMLLGAGREKKEDKIDYSAGIMLNVKARDYIKKGAVLAQLYTSNDDKIEEAKKLFLNSISYSDIRPEQTNLIYEKIV